MKYIYLISILFFRFGIGIAALFNNKAKLWVKGRQNWRKQLKKVNTDANTIWMHCASLGEFEQGRPLLEAIKNQHPNYQIVLTFFSPSGYEIRKNYQGADHIFYLPLDTAGNARHFINGIKPDVVVFVKYEFWYFFLQELKQRNIPTYLISALFRPDQAFFKWYGGLFKSMLFTFKHIFVQQEDSAHLLNEKLNLENLTVAGDTRIDRVIRIAEESKRYELVDYFCADKKVFVIGSSWPEDEAILLPFIQNDINDKWKVIIAPHEIGETHIKQIEQQLDVPYVRYTEARKNDQLLNSKVLIVNNIGMLSSLYRYGKLAYIGGGFGKGIHNILEPAAFKLPIVIGPKYQKFNEAIHLIQNKCAISVHNQEELKSAFKQLNEKSRYDNAQTGIQRFLQQNKGATAIILKELNL
ncbi:MAG: glycosyltransferase N-terminal domain-containing protein [Bacteroidota bacterium]